MEIALYIILTSIQNIGIFYLSYSIYRFRLGSYWKETSFASCIAACLIYFVRVLELKLFVPIIMCILLTLFIWLIVRIPIVFAALMVMTGYIASFFVEASVLFIFDYFKVFSFLSGDIFKDSSIVNYANVIMVVTNTLLFTISWWLYRKGFGFAFSFESKKVRFKKETVVFIIMIILSVIIISMIYYSVINAQINLFIAAIIFIISLGGLLLLALRKEYGNHG